jgi:hypothetical protein
VPAAAPPPARERRETAAQKAPNRNGGWRREGDRVAARFFPEHSSRVRERSRALSFRFLVGERKPKSRRRKLTETKNA